MVDVSRDPSISIASAPHAQVKMSDESCRDELRNEATRRQQEFDDAVHKIEQRGRKGKFSVKAQNEESEQIEHLRLDLIRSWNTYFYTLTASDAIDAEIIRLIGKNHSRMRSILLNSMTSTFMGKDNSRKFTMSQISKARDFCEQANLRFDNYMDYREQGECVITPEALLQDVPDVRGIKKSLISTLLLIRETPVSERLQNRRFV